MLEIIRETDTGKGAVRLYANGIMHQTYRERVSILKEDTDREIEIYKNEYCQELNRPILVDLTNIKATSRESRGIYSSPDTAKIFRAAALLIGNPVSQIMGNFYMGINKPAMPVKMFTDPNKAMEWLTKFLKE
jgi:hypothetical protein